MPSATPTPLLLVLVDGLSADTFAGWRTRMPHLAGLAERGLTVEWLGSVMPGTSLPGRVSMLTGTACHSHGVWGNVIWDSARFRYANPDDVPDPTLPAQALAAGLEMHDNGGQRSQESGQGIGDSSSIGVFVALQALEQVQGPKR